MKAYQMGLVVVALGLLACGGSDGLSGPEEPEGPEQHRFDAPWPSDLGSVYTTVFDDPAGDQQALPPEMAGPPYSGPVPYPPVDITAIKVGTEGAFLYMRVEFAGAIPSAPVHIPAEGEVEEQWVKNQGMNIALNVDGDIATGGGGEGVDGIDVFFAIGFDYGVHSQAYVNGDFPNGDLHFAGFHHDGEVGPGGPGFDYVVARYKIDELGPFFPRGTTVDIGSWSEAESFEETGSLKYHHFAFDLAIDGGVFPIPPVG